MRCVQTAAKIGNLTVEIFDAVDGTRAFDVLSQYGLRWTWGPGGEGLKHQGYGGPLEARVGCSLSHYLLWRLCLAQGEPILILEHDAVFLREFRPFTFKGACQINDPRGATKRGAWWSDQMAARGPGVHPKTVVLPDDVPDGLAGHSAYALQPRAARELIEKVHDIGLWPNDATMCRQFFPWLEELYPFVTRVEQGRSTTSES